MTERERRLFSELCRDEMLVHGSERDGIGTYNEKRVHRVIKRFISDDPSQYEVKIGKYVADVLRGNGIFEIQTGSFRTLQDKLKYYLENTECEVTVVHPITVRKTLIRAERETGEILRSSRSPKKERASDVLAELYHICETVPDPRLTVRLLCINVDEYRFSEARRYCRSGRYDNEIYPRELVADISLKTLEDWYRLIPDELTDGRFCTSDFEKSTRLCGRNGYYALTALCRTGMLAVETEGRRKFYSVKPPCRQ